MGIKFPLEVVMQVPLELVPMPGWTSLWALIVCAFKLRSQTLSNLNQPMEVAGSLLPLMDAFQFGHLQGSRITREWLLISGMYRLFL